MRKAKPGKRKTPRTRRTRDLADRLIPLPRGAAAPPRDRVTLGELVKPWGVRGEQTVTLHNPASDLLEQVDAVFVEGEGFPPRRVGLLGARRVGRRYVVHLEGIGGPEDAEHLRGLELSVAADELPPLDEEDEFYVRDLLGLAVVDGEGEPVGTLEDVIPTGSNDVYVVRGPDGERLIPAVRSFVAEVDLDEGRIRLAEDALVDLPVTGAGKEL